ncbi:MSMEG_1061 family FMN-dependent PPOX-type flavoprotein [Marinobacter bohaiensis]|uniref:MSMEG_1061 family FMN-dependent PPOX-type flavoprotein n=1 Tax=Marinobacter bohaiensis TaxID=2201898 RepID=UPI000DAEB6B7|nr:MSMEG_1061 family FMN-dependent PPOX-type flavoprotein [Marinobacter bohaiensis]
MYIESEQQLRELYGFPKEKAVQKQIGTLEKHSIRFIERAPFLVIASRDRSDAMDCSPRGGEPGFVRVLDNNTMLIPDAAGNKRLDSLVNILDTGDIGCIFMIPGINETVRVNGTARISVADEHLRHFPAVDGAGNPAKACIEVTVKEVFLHCARAFLKSGLWDQATHEDRSMFPGMLEMINDQIAADRANEPE